MFLLIAFLAGLKEAGRGDRPATVVIVAHRRATIALADDVVFVDNGRVAARGPHERLLREQPRYAELVLAYDAAEERRRAEAAGGHDETTDADVAVDLDIEGARP